MSKNQVPNRKWRSSLRTYLQAIPMDKRASFAESVGTTIGHLNGIVYGKYCNIEIAVALHKETNGEVSMEEMYPDLDWDYVRSVMIAQDVSVDADAIKQYLHSAIDSITVIPVERTDDPVLQG